MKQKSTDGESAKAVKEQVFLLRSKSEPGIVESSVSRSLAYYSGFSVAHSGKSDID